MFLVAGALAILLWRVPGSQASPVILVDDTGALNTTYVPYAVLAALGYGAVGLAGLHAYNIWAPIIKKNDIRAVPDPALAYRNREIMSDYLQRVIGVDPGHSPVLEGVRDVVGPPLAQLAPYRRQDEAPQPQPVAVPAPRPARPRPPQKKRRQPQRQKLRRPPPHIRT